eukprot:7139286-Prymnesium_polylepis.1
MAQRWPSASVPARDARMSRAPARGVCRASETVRGGDAGGAVGPSGWGRSGARAGGQSFAPICGQNRLLSWFLGGMRETASKRLNTANE